MQELRISAVCKVRGRAVSANDGRQLHGGRPCHPSSLTRYDRPASRPYFAIASMAALRGYAYASAYTAAKHAVLGLMRSLALELASTRVTVNAVCPGFTDTDLLAASIDNIVRKPGAPAMRPWHKFPDTTRKGVSSVQRKWQIPFCGCAVRALALSRARLSRWQAEKSEQRVQKKTPIWMESP